MISSAEAEGTERVDERHLNVICGVGDDLFAIAALDVFKVVDSTRLGRLPRLPSAVAGITHYRGRIVTVVKLASLVGERDHELEPTGRERILILDRGQRNVGLQVASVEEIAPLHLGEERENRGLGRLIPFREGAVTLLDTDVLWARLRELQGSDEDGARERQDVQRESTCVSLPAVCRTELENFGT